MQVTVNDFIKKPDFYLGQIDIETVHITKDGKTIAILAKPNNTPITNNLLGILKDTGIKNVNDIKAMRTGA